MALPAEKARYTFADVLAWGEDERIEVINGEAVMMAPPLRVHQSVLSALFLQIGNYLQGKPCKVYPVPFAVRPFEEDGDAPEDVDTMLEPDITVVCDPDNLDKYGCKGSPDMVIEILSPSTRRHDLAVKYRLYQRAGVREYWIVDPDGKTVQVFRLEDGFMALPLRPGSRQPSIRHMMRNRREPLLRCAVLKDIKSTKPRCSTSSASARRQKQTGRPCMRHGGRLGIKPQSA